MKVRLSDKYVADEFTLNCQGITSRGNVKYSEFNEQLQWAIQDRRYKVQFLAHMGDFVKLKFAGYEYNLVYNYETDWWEPDL